MTNKYTVIILLLSIFILPVSCAKNSESVNCLQLRTQLIERDPHFTDFIDKWCTDLNAKPTFGDAEGQEKNLEILIERINNGCNVLKASQQCYNCMLSLPPQSIIQIEMDSMGIQVKRNITVQTSKKERIKPVAVN